MIIRKDSPTFGRRRKKDVEFGAKDKYPIFNVELRDDESVQLLVPASDGRTCVHLEVISGKLHITGGASIIDSIDVEGYARIPGYKPEPEPEPFTGLRTISEMAGTNPKALRLLQDRGITTASDLAGCTFDLVEAICGSDFATKAAKWLKTLGLQMKY